MRAVQISSVEVNTRSTYGAGLLRFTQYCDEFGISELARMPASDVLLAGFVSSGAGKVGSAQQWVSGLALWHRINGAPWLGSTGLQAALAGVKKNAPTSSKRPPRPPVTFQHITALLRGLDLTNTRDAAIWAASSVAFWSICRLGELVPVSADVFTADKHVARGAPLAFGRERGGHEHATLHIPFSKTTGAAGADISITDIEDETSPFHALQYHLQVNAEVPAHAPFFAYEEGDGWKALTRAALMDQCNAVWSAAGIPGIGGGHSFRIGGTTEWLLRGAPPDMVAIQGRWRSDAFLRYWRRVEIVLPFFMSRTFTASQITHLDSIMDNFSRTARVS
ncbi:DNA breaking-rejoining enzyme [Auriscalpium vulgare]|uniref:DNA breaking-rejoining enzyme n=1 Tax=Auriscalpium vulgare TaxID=40419 RepID=A0ACB8R1S2_9AGAM|nr:DNA breaking-rejoining enzyme [Auriscalpium vulgare]